MKQSSNISRKCYCGNVRFYSFFHQMPTFITYKLLWIFCLWYSSVYYQSYGKCNSVSVQCSVTDSRQQLLQYTPPYSRDRHSNVKHGTLVTLYFCGNNYNYFILIRFQTREFFTVNNTIAYNLYVYMYLRSLLVRNVPVCEKHKI